MPEVTSGKKKTVYGACQLIPENVRNVVAISFSPKPIAKIGQQLYWFCAKQCTRTFKDKIYVDKVAVRGGLLHQCDPGISDIDLTIYCADHHCGAEELWDIRKTYRTLKSCFPMLGEVRISTPTIEKLMYAHASQPAFTRRYIEETSLQNGRWIPAKRAMPDCLPQSIFAFCFEFFFLAHTYLHKLNCGRNEYLNTIMLKKQLLKVFEYSGRARPLIDTSIEELLSGSIGILDELAGQALLASLPASPECTLEMRVSPPSSEQQILSLREFAQFSKNRKLKEKIEFSEVPLFIKLKSMDFRDDLKNTCTDFLNETKKRISSNRTFCPMLVTENMEVLYRLGWPGARYLKHLNIPIRHEDNLADTLAAMRSNTFWAAYEGAIWSLIYQYMVLLTSNDRDKIHQAMKSLCLTSMALSASYFTWNDDDIIERARDIMPRSAEFIERLKTATYRDNSRLKITEFRDLLAVLWEVEHALCAVGRLDQNINSM